MLLLDLTHKQKQYISVQDNGGVLSPCLSTGSDKSKGKHSFFYLLLTLLLCGDHGQFYQGQRSGYGVLYYDFKAKTHLFVCF